MLWHVCCLKIRKVTVLNCDHILLALILHLFKLVFLFFSFLSWMHLCMSPETGLCQQNKFKLEQLLVGSVYHIVEHRNRHVQKTQALLLCCQITMPQALMTDTTAVCCPSNQPTNQPGDFTSDSILQETEDTQTSC